MLLPPLPHLEDVIRDIGRAGGVLVTASGNGRLGHPRLNNQRTNCALSTPNRLLGDGDLALSTFVVGATDGNGRLWMNSERFPDDNTDKIVWAPGQQVRIPFRDPYWFDDGTSLAAPKVAGLIAYLRGLDSPWKADLEVPANVKKMVRALSRPLDIRDGPWRHLLQGLTDQQKPVVPFIWNGQVLWESCLLSVWEALTYKGRLACPRWPASLGDPNWSPAPGGPGGPTTGDDFGGIPMPGPITWQPGPAQPICDAAQTSSQCGRLCSGSYYCDRLPVGSPPDHADPAPPRATFILMSIDGGGIYGLDSDHFDDCFRIAMESDHYGTFPGMKTSYPWDLDEFEHEGGFGPGTSPLCATTMHFDREPSGDYKVMDVYAGTQVGRCTKSTRASKTCGPASSPVTFTRVYDCTGAC